MYVDIKLLRLSSDITPIRQTSEKIMLPHIVAAAAVRPSPCPLAKGLKLVLYSVDVPYIR